MDIYIYHNSSLTSLVGIQNIDVGTITNLFIEHNPSLSICEVENVCNFLDHSMGSEFISHNSVGCNNSNQILLACESSGIYNDVEITDFSIYPNPLQNDLSIKNNYNLQIEGIRIINLQGHVLLRASNYYEKIDITNLKAGYYIVEINTTEKTFRQSILVNK